MCLRHVFTVFLRVARAERDLCDVFCARKNKDDDDGVRVCLGVQKR